MTRLTTIAAVAALIAAGSALAQRQAPPRIPSVPAAPGFAQQQSILAAFEAAQAAASQPGDDRLSCDELQAQFTATFNDPALRAFIDGAGAAAQREMATVQAGLAAIPGQTARAAANAANPAGGAAATAEAIAQAQASQAAAAGHMQARMAQAEQLTAQMPRIMRAQRLTELGASKRCSWADEAALAVPGLAPPAR